MQFIKLNIIFLQDNPMKPILVFVFGMKALKIKNKLRGPIILKLRKHWKKACQMFSWSIQLIYFRTCNHNEANYGQCSSISYKRNKCHVYLFAFNNTNFISDHSTKLSKVVAYRKILYIVLILDCIKEDYSKENSSFG